MQHDGRAAGVVLSPHPDDAVLSAWSTLRRAGEVVVVNEKFGIRLTDVITPSERIKRLNK